MPHSSSNEEPLGIAGARFLQAGCSHIQPTMSKHALSLSYFAIFWMNLG